jgi:hypothetical protein
MLLINFTAEGGGIGSLRKRRPPNGSAGQNTGYGQSGAQSWEEWPTARGNKRESNVEGLSADHR